jgi:hypothetical protein
VKKLSKLFKQLDAVKKEIESLKAFRQTKKTKEFLRGLFAENSYITNQIKKLQLSSESKQEEKKQRRQRANLNRSTKMSRSWRFFKSIQENYLPDKSTKEIRSQFSKFKKGLETDISEVMWRNPSP